MATNLERASLVARAVQIESVTLTQTAMDADLDPLDAPRELRLGQQFRCRYETRAAQQNRLFVYVSLLFDASVAPEGPAERRVVDLSATFLATYRIEGAASFPEDALQHFADLNGTYNVWPYWRELVHTFAGRAGLSGIVVPVFQPPVRPVHTQEELTLERHGASPALPESVTTPG